ncbi:unnamed protein product, partial [Didymodactylos carnosus]
VKFNDGPKALYLDKQEHLYVSLDSYPGRVLKYSFRSTTPEETVITNEPSSLAGVFVDQCGTVYTAAQPFGGIGTIKKFFNVSSAASVVVASDLNRPWGLTLDKYGNFYVVEMYGNRVQRISVRDGVMEVIINKSAVEGNNAEHLREPESLILGLSLKNVK